MAQKVTVTPDPNARSDARVVEATPDPSPPTSLASVLSPPQITATPDPFARSNAVVQGATPFPNAQSAARVQYGGPQITATPEAQYQPGILGLLQRLSNTFGPLPNPKSIQSKSDARVVKDKGTAGGGAVGSVANPELAANQLDPNALALQMFFTSTIAPYLDQIRGSMNQNATLAQQALSNIPGLAPQLQPYFNGDRQAAQIRSLGDALAAATAAGPSYDQLIGQISAAQDAQRYAAYQAMKAQSGQAAGGLIGALLGAGAADDSLAGLLGGDLAAEAKKNS